MFRFLKRKTQIQASTLSRDMRELMFGDLPFDRWSAPDVLSYEALGTIKRALELGHSKRAIAELKRVLNCPGLESTQYLQAWYFLRQIGEAPLDDEKHVYGVIIEVGINDGLDVLGAY